MRLEELLNKKIKEEANARKFADTYKKLAIFSATTSTAIGLPVIYKYPLATALVLSLGSFFVIFDIAEYIRYNRYSKNLREKYPGLFI